MLRIERSDNSQTVVKLVAEIPSMADRHLTDRNAASSPRAIAALVHVMELIARFRGILRKFSAAALPKDREREPGKLTVVFIARGLKWLPRVAKPSEFPETANEPIRVTRSKSLISVSKL